MRVLCQNENGPCPLLALANALILKGAMVLPNGQGAIATTEVVHMVALRLLESNSQSQDEALAIQQRSALDECLNLLPLLLEGLDVNIKFSSCSAFEFDKGVTVFDMLNVALYHGWVVDPQHEAASLLLSLSYNQAAAKVVDPATSQFDRLLIENFLDSTQSQLTHEGLVQLHETIKEGQVCVLFRANHFSTCVKHESQLYTLCTDVGFANRAAIAWESLHDVGGDSELLSPTFGSPEAYLSLSDREPGHMSQNTNNDNNAASPTETFDADRELAIELQIQESRNADAMASAAALPVPRARTPPASRSSSLCSIC